jgi:nitrogen fixation protein NifB
MTPSLSPPSKNCGCTQQNLGDTLASRDERIKERIAKHPCYSEEAHHHYARMHVAVAPACNIQCNYCNRKYDCANESRPGVVSEVLTPEEAAHKVLVIAGKIPQMTVVGIAGPGDPLANPKQTFETFARIAEKAPDIKLCLSTNGLNLPDYVDKIKELNIDHVTITINTVDPEIGARIYPWIRWQRKRIAGIEGVKILLERQQEGLQALQEADILCKVNSVMIPGINDQHLVEVNQAIRERGAFLHNIMPLISAPEHGTYFGLNGQRGPTPKELKELQDKCAGNMKMMRHCRQCRADAVGLLRGRPLPRVHQREIHDHATRIRYGTAAVGAYPHRTPKNGIGRTKSQTSGKKCQTHSQNFGCRCQQRRWLGQSTLWSCEGISHL